MRSSEEANGCVCILALGVTECKKLSSTTTGWPMFVRLGEFKRSKIRNFNF